MASTVKLLITFIDSLVDVGIEFLVSNVETVGGVIASLVVIYGIKGFLAILGD